MRRPSPSLLLVAPEDRVTDAACAEALPAAAWTRCDSLDAAAAYLSAATFDGVVVDAGLGGDEPALRDRLGVPVHVLDGADAGAIRRAVGQGGDPEALLREVLTGLARAVHDANNPLTVITGNAQYALEMSRALEVDASLVRSIEDVHEAGRRLEAAMAELSEMRRRLTAALDAAGNGIGRGGGA